MNTRKATVETLKHELEQSKLEVEHLKQRLENTTTELDSIKLNMNIYKEETDESREELTTVQEDYNEMVVRFNKAVTEKQILTKTVEELELSLTQANTIATEQKTQLELLINEKEIPTEVRFSQLESELTILKQEKEELELQLQETRSETSISETESQKEQIVELRKAIKESTNANKIALNRINKLKSYINESDKRSSNDKETSAHSVRRNLNNNLDLETVKRENKELKATLKVLKRRYAEEENR